MMLTDEGDYEGEIRLTGGKYLAFGHGFNIHFKKITPPKDERLHGRAEGRHLVQAASTKGQAPAAIAVDPSGDTARSART
jgi:ketol-acid reductoisomerase